MTRDRIVLLGVTGSIAAYKAVELASRLVQGGVKLDVVMTDSAIRFVTPLTFRSITHRPVVTDIVSIDEAVKAYVEGTIVDLVDRLH